MLSSTGGAALGSTPWSLRRPLAKRRVGGWLELLEDPQQVQRAGVPLLRAGLGGHDALQSSVDAAEELDPQLHSAPPLNASTLTGRAPHQHDRTFQSTFQLPAIRRPYGADAITARIPPSSGGWGRGPWPRRCNPTASSSAPHHAV